MSLLLLAVLAKVVAVTSTTVYIDAGTADGLIAGASWQTTVGGQPATVRVIAAASHDAVLEVEGATLAIGAQIDLPAGTTPPPPAVALRPSPQPAPPWQPRPEAMHEIQIAAEHQQPPGPAPDHLMIDGEIALSAFLAGDLSKDPSTSWQDLALSSQLSVVDGRWRYDHVLEARLAGSPEWFSAPLQNAQARFDVYLLRLQYTDPRFIASVGRQPSAALAEFGVVDGARASVGVGSGVSVEGFAGLRPATDLAMALIPHLGADVAWQTKTADGTDARVDAGLLIDEYTGSLDRAAVAASSSISTTNLVLHGDTVVDLSSDAFGNGGGRLTRAYAFARHRRGKLTGALQGGYDKPFIDRAFLAEIPNIVYGPRTFIGGEADYAWRPGLIVGSTVRVSTGDGFTSTYYDVIGTLIRDRIRYSLAPHAVVGSLVDQIGVRGDVGWPLWHGDLQLGGSFDRVWATGAAAWAGIGRTAYSLAFWDRWRASGSAEIAAGDGPPRMFLFLLLAYRL